MASSVENDKSVHCRCLDHVVLVVLGKEYKVKAKVVSGSNGSNKALGC